MKSFLVSIVLVSSLISAAPVASEVQVIHSDAKSKRCEMLKEGKVVGTCDLFKFVKIDKFYLFLFSFKKGQIGFETIPATVKGNISVFVATELYLNGKAQDLIKKPTFCYIHKKYLVAQCSANGYDIEYSRY